MIKYLKRRRIENKILDLVTKICISINYREEWKNRGSDYDYYVKLEDDYIGKAKREIISLCDKLNELSPN